MPIFSIAFVLLLSCSMVTPPNLVVVVGGVLHMCRSPDAWPRDQSRRSILSNIRCSIKLQHEKRVLTSHEPAGKESIKKDGEESIKTTR
jgi:hypothetical protein